MQHRLCVCGLSAYADADASASSLPPAESRRESMKSFILRSETWVELWCGSVVLAGVMRMTYSSPPPLPPGIRLAFQIDAAVPQSLSWKSSLWATGLLFSLSLFAVVVCFFDVCHSNTHTHTNSIIIPMMMAMIIIIYSTTTTTTADFVAHISNSNLRYVILSLNLFLRVHNLKRK